MIRTLLLLSFACMSVHLHAIDESAAQDRRPSPFRALALKNIKYLMRSKISVGLPHVQHHVCTSRCFHPGAMCNGRQSK